MHARKNARDAYFPSRFDDVFFTTRGDITFKDTGDARRFADRVNARDDRQGAAVLRPAELAAMALVHEIAHAVIRAYRTRHPGAFGRLRDRLAAKLGGAEREAWLTFLRVFPTPAIYAHFQGEGDETPEKVLARDGAQAEEEISDELLLLWLTNQNPAYEPVREIVTDRDLGETYQRFVGEARAFFEGADTFGPSGETLMDLLLAPSRHAPNDILAQLEFIERTWSSGLGLEELGLWRRVLWARDFLNEEGKYFFRGGPGPGAPKAEAMQFGRVDEEPERFSADLDWMPRVVLVAKTVFVWLGQLTKKYDRPIDRLDQIPDEELDLLAARGFTGLWLIGLFERSKASKQIKQMRGDQDAVASAYSLMRYDIAEELGGFAAYENLKQRAWKRGVRLAADMVPNHVGIDADWVVNHPDWFIQTSAPPFPAYRFGGTDLSEDPRVGVFIEEGYWTKTDAAVVFRRHDRQTGQDRFLYHGNDGTSMPWNDTAQLDYLKAEVRHAVIETILHVARMFPIIRFDAAMTLAKRHVQRLWYPLPGQGGAIPSRSDYAMTQEELDSAIPVEFWREVVDTVAARAPDTLLLAEAFWMMEGYFVRTLGMHRVYNSAFMNMLKREENQKYRETIKNVLEFDPEILKRFVNFMSNPDEETAVAQFGTDDKYFGVCVLMCTMPGLPMFGHGQVEGFHEKYGMEYRRAKWDERPNDGLVQRHEREIFPLAKKRYVFSGVENFALYDFVTDGGGIDEDVYAYSNAAGHERALVVFNNKWKETRGRIVASIPAKRASQPIAEAMGVTGENAEGEWMIFRDLAKGLEYLRPTKEIEGGFAWTLKAFEYHVFDSFRAVHDTPAKAYAELAAELDGGGVPSIERALVSLRLRPVHTPLAEAVNKGHLDYLLAGWNEKEHEVTGEALVAFDERLRNLAAGLSYMRGLEPGTLATDVPIAKAQSRYEALMAIVHAKKGDPKSVHATGTNGETSTTTATATATTATTHPRLSREHAETLLAWLHVEALLAMIAMSEPDDSDPDLAKASATKPTTPTRETIIESWELATPLARAFAASGSNGPERAALTLLAATLPIEPLRKSMAAGLENARGQSFLDIHESDGVRWLNKESFERLAQLLAEREAVEGRASVALAERQFDDVVEIAEAEGYRADAIGRALTSRAPKPKPSAATKDTTVAAAAKATKVTSSATPLDAPESKRTP